jgi:hypothetical protein
MGFDPEDLADTVITVDAMHTHDDTAELIHELKADDVFTVKANRPTLLARVPPLSAREGSAAGRSRRV